MIFRKQDAIRKRDEYQDALDFSHEGIKKMSKHLNGMNHKLKDYHAKVKKYKKDIEADEEEKRELYATVNNLLVSETNFEKEMLKTSQKGKKASKVIIKPNIRDSDVDDFRINAVQEYFDKYPEYATKSTYKKILDKIERIEAGIKETKKKYNYSASNLGKELDYWPKNIMHAKDLIKRFKTQKKQFEEKLNKMRYVKSVAFKLASETEKDKVRIHDLYYRLEEYENTVNKLEEEYKEVKREGIHKLN